MGNRNLKTRLREINRLAALDNTSAPAASPPDRYRLMAAALGGELRRNHAGVFCLVETDYPPDYRHGSQALAQVLECPDLPRSAFSALDEPGRVSRDALLFLDTETTGLGGSGTVAFLIACGVLSARGLTVRQYIIPDYSDECAMLEALLDEYSPDTTLVTYNGKAFDVPILRDRMIINRVARDVEVGGHIDLLHPARRLFRRRLQDCSLGSLERHLLAFERRGDIPGYLIPSVYFDWLTEQRLDDMEAVMEHNRLDIVSLAFAAVRIAEIFETDGRVLSHADDMHSLARVYRRRRRDDRVIDLVERTGSTVSSGPLPPDILLFHAQAFKRSGDFTRAADLWQRLAGGRSREAYWANLELAKYNEHRLKDYRRALACALRAKRLCPYGPSHHEAVARRLDRLRGRLAATA